MLETTTVQPTKRDAFGIRAELLEGLCTDIELADALGVNIRTVYRLDLPYLKIGARRYYDVKKSRERLLQRRCGERSAPRPPGRPRKYP